MNCDSLWQRADRFATRPWLAPASIFLLALAPRLGLALHLPAAILWPDGTRYMRIADSLLAGHGFGSLLINQYSVPTQPLLLAAVRALFGDSFLALRVVFALMGALTCAVGFALTRRLFGAIAALIAGLGLALYPHFIYLAPLFEYPQTFFMLAMAVAFLAYYSFRDGRRIWVLMACGLALGLSILSVPTVLLFAPLLVAWLIFEQRGRAILYAPLLILAISMPVAAWAVRNYVAYGAVILVNKGAGFNFWIANSDTYYRLGKVGVTPPCAPGYTDTSFCLAYRTLHRELKSLHLPQVQFLVLEDDVSFDNGVRYLRASLPRAASLTLRKFADFWSPIPDAVHSGGSFGGSWTRWVAAVTYLPVLMLGLLGVILSASAWRALLPVYAYFAVFVGTYSFFLPTMRYRLPLDFFLIIFSAQALHTLSRRFQGVLHPAQLTAEHPS